MAADKRAARPFDTTVTITARWVGMSYIIFTDSNTDIPYELAEQHDLHICYMPYTLNVE